MAEIGSTLGGRYRLIELLGQGGMATIYRAHDRQLDRDVAVKVLRPEYGNDPAFLARFRQEAQAAASLNHPNVVGVYDYGDDRAGPYIVMELVDGEDLATLIRRNGPLPPRKAARLAAEIARGLAAAHVRGIVHRDMKSANVMLTRDGQPKVGDFGIARAMAEAQLTLPGTTLGSVHYFSPEQARGEAATPASDVFSLGIVLYELLTGRRPWEGDSAGSVAVARLSGPIPVPSEVQPDVPPELDGIVRRALARDPAERYPSASAMADALEAFVAGRPIPTGAVAAAAAGAGMVAADTAADGLAGATGAATIASGVARGAPLGPVPYAPDAYAGATGGTPGYARRAIPGPEVEEEADGGGNRALPWIAGLLGLLVLAAVAFLLYQLLSGPKGVAQVTVPTFVGQTISSAQTTASRVGLQVQTTSFVPNPGGQPDGTITAQDPPPGATADRGSTVNLTVVAGEQLATVPDLRGRTEADALNALTGVGLVPGTVGEAFDPVVPAGSVVSQDLRANTRVPAGTAVAYVVSKGPQPTPSPSPTPTPTQAPTPTPPPTPTPTPAPTPTAAPTATPTTPPSVPASVSASVSASP